MDGGCETATTEAGAARTTEIGVCGICAAGCGVNVHFLDGRIERLTPLKNHPLGIICPRGGWA